MKTLKTIEEHEKQVFERMRPREVGTGVQCPQCGEEMFYDTSGIVLASNPPQKHVHCNSCKYHTTMFV